MNCIVGDITLQIERVANFVNFRTIIPLFKQRGSVNVNGRVIFKQNEYCNEKEN